MLSGVSGVVGLEANDKYFKNIYEHYNKFTMFFINIFFCT